MADLEFSVGTFGAFDYMAGRGIENRPDRLINCYEFEFYTEDHEGGLYNDGVFYPARKNYCILAKPGQIQQVVRPKRGYYFNVFSADPELSDRLDRLPNSFEMWDMEEVVEQIKQMNAAKVLRSVEGKLIRQSCACRILSMLSRYSKLPQGLERISSQHRQTILMADRFIREHYFLPLNLEVLARRCSLEKTYFHKLYTTAFGMSPAQRILALRIGAAKLAVLEAKIPLEEIAANCGFSSQSYFCYKFKQVLGQTPVEYRDSIRRQLKN